MSHTPSDDKGLREEISKIFDDTRIDYEGVYEPEATDLLMALISQKIIEARLDEMERTAKYAGAWMNPSSGERTVNWVNMEVINSRITELEATLTTKQDTKQHGYKEDK